MNIKSQSKEKKWRDESGQEIPSDRITQTEKLKEKNAFKIATGAFKISKQLATFKAEIKKLCMEVFNLVLNEPERLKAKGNFTWYNFNSTIKIEVNINDNIEFDELLIEKAKQILLGMVGEAIKPEMAFMKDLVLSAFQTSKGKLDPKKVLGMKKWTERVNDERYTQAMKFIDQSIRRPDSKTYFRVWVKDEDRKWQNIDLNFSSIEA